MIRPLDEPPPALAEPSPIRRPLNVSTLPVGTLSIGAGLCVLGLTVYAFLTVSARALGAERYAALSALWALVFLVGPGAFFPVEQEVSRAVAARVSSGEGIAPALRRAGFAAIGMATGLALLAGVLARPLLDDVFDNQVLVLVGFVTSLFGYAAAHLGRGVLSGLGRFRAYAVLLGAEGALRLAAAVTLVALGVRTAGPLALVVGVAPFAAVAVAMTCQRGILTPGPPAPWAELSRSLGFLLLASLLAQVLIHAGPLVVKLLAVDDSKELTARFFAGVMVTRVPLFLFFALQAAVLPRLVSFVALGDRPGFRQTLNRLLAVVGALGAGSVAGAFLFGQEVVELLFGHGFVLDDRGLALLAASTAGIMIALSLGQALVALDGQAVAAACWALGVIAFVMVIGIGQDVLLRVELGLVAGSAAVAMAMAFSLRSPLHRAMTPVDEGSTVVVTGDTGN